MINQVSGKGYSRCNRGFTLLEILISISIFAVLATMVYGSLNAVLSKNDAIRESTTVYEMAKNTLNRISMDLTATFVTQYPDFQVPGALDSPDPYRFYGDEDFQQTTGFSTLRFASTEHLGISSNVVSGLTRIIYYADRSDDPKKGPFVLRRSDNPFPYDLDPDEPPYRPLDTLDDPVICEKVESFSLTFVDEAGDEHRTWDSDSEMTRFATPRAVIINMKIASETGTREFTTRVDIPVYRKRIENVRRQ